jgi:hypothetical protein
VLGFLRQPNLRASDRTIVADRSSEQNLDMEVFWRSEFLALNVGVAYFNSKSHFESCLSFLIQSGGFTDVG